MNSSINQQIVLAFQKVADSLQAPDKDQGHAYLSIESDKKREQVKFIPAVKGQKPRRAAQFSELTHFFAKTVKQMDEYDKRKLLNSYKIIKQEFENKKLGFFSNILEMIFHRKARQIEAANRAIEEVEKELKLLPKEKEKSFEEIEALEKSPASESVHDQIQQMIMQREGLTDLPSLNIEAHSLLNKRVLPPNTPRTPELTKDLFAHIHGDTFIGKTGLEGYSSDQVLEFFDHTLSQEPTLASYQDSPFHQLVKTGKEIASIIYSRVDNERKEKDLQDYIKGKVSSKTPFLLPGGWTGRPSGHAMYYEAIPQPSGSYTLRVYNTGAGIETYHPSLYEGGQQKCYPFIEYQNIPAAQLSDTFFTRALIEIQTQLPALELPQYSARDIYEVILPQLGGKIVKPDLSSGRPSFILPQHSGICSVAGLMAVARNTSLSSNSDSQDFSVFQYQLKLHSLIRFYHTRKDNLEEDEEARLLLKKSTETFLREVLDLYREGKITTKDFQAAYATSQEVLNAIESAQRTADRANLLEKEDFVIASGERSEQLIYESLSSFTTKSVPASGSLVAAGRYVATAWDFNANPVTARTIHTVLDRFNAHCSALYTDGQYKATVHLINRMFDDLPLPGGDPDFWSTLSEEQRRQCMENIYHLSNLLLRSSATYQTDARREIDNQLSACKGMAIQHQLALLSGQLGTTFAQWQIPHSLVLYHLEGLIGDNYSSRDTVLEEDFNIYEKHKRDQWLALKNYFKKVPDEDATPGWDKIGGPFAIFENHNDSIRFDVLAGRDDIKWAMQRIQEVSTASGVNPLSVSEYPLHIQAAFILHGQSVLRKDLPPLNPVDVLPREYEYLKQQAGILQLITLGRKEDVPLPPTPLTTLTIKRHDYSIKRKPIDFSNLTSKSEPESVTFLPDYRYRLSIEQRRFRERQINYPFNLRKSKLAGLLLIYQRGFHLQKLTYEYYDPAEEYSHYSDLFKDKEDFQEMNFALMGETYHVENNKKRFRNFQTTKLISYFTKYIDKLSHLDFQDFFRYLLFESNSLENGLAQNPLLAKTLNEFVSNGYRKFLGESNLQAAIFFLHLKTMLSPILASHRQEFDRREIQENITSLMNHPHCTPDQKALLHQLIISSYASASPPLPEGDIQLLLQSTAFIGIHPVPQNLKIAPLEEQTEKVLFRFSDNIHDVLAIKGDVILNAIIHTIRPDQTPYEGWNMSRFPWCVSPDDQIAFHALEGVVCMRGGRLGTLPLEIREDPKFIKLFGKDSSYDASYLGEGVYTLTDKIGVTTRIIFNPTPPKEIIFQKELRPGKWYEWKPSSSTDIPLPSQHLQDSSHFWYPVPGALVDERDEEILLTDKNTDQISHRVIFDSSNRRIQSVERIGAPFEPPLRLVDIYSTPEILKINRIDSLRSHLESLAENTIRSMGSSATVRFTDIKKFLIDQNVDAFKAACPDLTQKQADLLTTTLKNDFDKHQTSYKFLRQLEDIRYIHVWERPQSGGTATPAMIELPRLGLKFNIVEEGGRYRAKCGPPLKDYTIASEQRINGMGSFTEYLVLEDKEGRKKVIIPRRKINYEEMKGGGLTTQALLEKHPPEDVEKTASPFLVYDLDAQRNLVATKPEQSLFLAYLRLGKKQYTEAMKLIREFSRKLKPYSATEKEMVKWIESLQPDSKELEERGKRDYSDQDPKGSAVYLCAIACFLKNAKTFEEEDQIEINWKNVANKYLTQYRPVKDHATTLKLSKEEEILLLKHLIKQLGEDAPSNLITCLKELDEGIQTDVLISPKPPAETKDLNLMADSLEKIVKRSAKNQNPRLLRRNKEWGDGFLEFYERAKQGDIHLKKELAYLKGDVNNRSLCLFLETVLENRHDPEFPKASVLVEKMEADDRESATGGWISRHRSYYLHTAIQDMLAHARRKITAKRPWIVFRETTSAPHTLDTRQLVEAPSPSSQPVEMSGAKRKERKQQLISLMIRQHPLTKGKNLAKIHLLELMESGNKKTFRNLYPAFSEQDVQKVYEDFKVRLEQAESSPLVDPDVVNQLFVKKEPREGATALPKLSERIREAEYQDLLEDAAFADSQKKSPDYSLKFLLETPREGKELHRLFFKYDQDVLAEARKVNPDLTRQDLVTLIVHDNVQQFQAAHPSFSEEEANKLKANLIRSLQALQTKFEKKETISRAGPSVDLSDPSTPLSQLYTHLSVQSAALKKESIKNEYRLLALANKYPVGREGIIQKTEELGTLRNRIELNDLFVLFIQKDRTEFKKRNPALTNEEIDQLNELIAEHLAQNTKRQQIDRAIKTLKEMEALGRVDIEDANLQELTNRLQKELTIQRAFDPYQKPEFLLFEYASDITLRRDQVEKLDLMINPPEGRNPNMILQSIMGSGKSKVFLPILALKNADEDHLSVVVVPEALYESVAEDLLNQSRGIFKQVTHVKNFDRNTQFTVESLQDLVNDFKNIRRKKEYLLMTSKSLACLQLKLQETLSQYIEERDPNAKAELAKKIELAREVMILLKQGKAIFDEADTLLNCRHEINFSVGEAEPLQKEYRQASLKVFDLLNTSEVLLSKFPSGLLSTSITKEIYEKDVKPVLIELITTDMLIELINKDVIPFFTFSQHEGIKQLIRDYLNNQSLDILKRVRPPLDGVLAIYKGHINELLPVTLSKEYNTNFGFSKKDPSKLLAIPYLASNTPNEAAQFGNPYELLDYTVRMYQIEGIPFHQLKRHIERLQKDARAAMALNPGMTIEETPAYEEFREICNDPKVHFLACTDKDIHDIKAAIYATRGLPEERNTLMNYVSKYVLPQIQVYPKKISLNPQGLVEMFGQVQGFTGTPWNSATFHQKLESIEVKGTDGETLNLLWKKCQGKVDALTLKPMGIGQTKADVLVESLAESQRTNPNFRAIIDAGAMFKGIDNLSVAKSLLKRFETERPEIKGICFYDGNKCVVLEQGKEHPIPFSESNLKEDERFTYYDHSHTVGADIKQATLAHAITTISKDLKWRDLAQAVWRLRGIGRQQQISFAYLPEEAAIMRDLLQLPENTPLTLEDIIKLVKLNQNKQKQEHAVAGTFQKIHHELTKTVWNEICNPKHSIEKVIPLFAKGARLFIKPTKDDPVATYGEQEERVSKQEAMRARVVQELDSFDEINPILQSIRGESTTPLALQQKRAEFERSVEKVIGREAFKLMPQRIIGVSADLESEVEQEAEKEQEQEVQKEVEMEVVAVAERRPVNHPSFWQWRNRSHRGSTLSIYSKDYYIPADPRSFEVSRSSYLQDSVPIWSLRQVVASQRNLEQFKNLFSDDLCGSFNFLPLKFMIARNLMTSEVEQRRLFDEDQYPFMHRLVIKEKTSGGEARISTIAISQDDAYALSKRLAEEAPETAAVELYLCDKNLGVIQASSNANPESLKSDPRFVEQQAVMDLFNGEMEFRVEKQAALKNWIESKGKKHVQQFFEEVILKNKPDLKNRYTHSWLKKYFTEISTAA